MELRLADINDAALVAKPRLAGEVPAGRPGRGMIGQNYERAGWEPVGLHTLMARPALESTAAEVFDSRSVADGRQPTRQRVYPGAEGAPPAPAGGCGRAGRPGGRGWPGGLHDGVGAR